MLASRNSYRLLLGLLLGTLSSSGCSEPKTEVSAAAQVCQKLDECDMLGSGMSVTDCSNSASDCLAVRMSSERDDWTIQASDCVKFNSRCGSFVGCIEQVAYCGLGSMMQDPRLDAGPEDSGPRDSGPLDAGPQDAGPQDAGPQDAAPRDAGPQDAAPRDAEPRDAEPHDSSLRDAEPDPSPADSGWPDAAIDIPATDDAGPIGNGVVPRLVRGLIQPEFLYSAYESTRTYQVTPSVPAAAEGWEGEAVLASSVRWSVDSLYVTSGTFPELIGAVRLTMKRSGSTVVKVTATTLSGEQVRGEATLRIDAVSATEVAAGETAYSTVRLLDWTPAEGAAEGEGACGLPATISLPATSACNNCHNQSSTISVEHTPTQTAGHSDAALINLFTTGTRIPGEPFHSPFLRSAPMPDCLFTRFHTSELTDEEANGIVAKLRSLPPKVMQEIDFARLAEEARRKQMP